MADQNPLRTENIYLGLNGRWGLEELSHTAREYIQLYGFAYSLVTNLPTAREDEIDYIYGKFPWRGGFSTVNFFNQLFHKIPIPLRPQVQRIQYASPGFIELKELLLVAITVASIVAAVCKSINMAHDTYRNIQRAKAEHKLTEIDLAKKEIELTKEQIEFCKNASRDLSKVFDLSAEQERLLDQRTQHNPLMKLKILLSVFRRVEPLAKKQSLGLLQVNGHEDSLP